MATVHKNSILSIPEKQNRIRNLKAANREKKMLINELKCSEKRTIINDLQAA